MEFKKAKEKNISNPKLREIRDYAHVVNFGSEITCYNVTSKHVIKIFKSTVDVNSKLLIPHNIYGTNTYIFIDCIINYYNKIIAYTMQYIKGPILTNHATIKLFYDLTYETLLEYIDTLLKDSKTEANHGIQVYDCFPSNIILSENGFKQIDCVDFKYIDKDPSEIEKENIRLMCQTIYDYVIAPHLSTFIINHNLTPGDFTHSPYEFIKELKTISENYSDEEIITLNDTKILSRKK